MNDIIKNQIITIRDMGLTNMFDYDMVSIIADTLEFYELSEFIQFNKQQYVHFILTGEY
jgi:hypothetical protein